MKFSIFDYEYFCFKNLKWIFLSSQMLFHFPFSLSPMLFLLCFETKVLLKSSQIFFYKWRPPAFCGYWKGPNNFWPHVDDNDNQICEFRAHFIDRRVRLPEDVLTVLEDVVQWSVVASGRNDTERAHPIELFLAIAHCHQTENSSNNKQIRCPYCWC